jgi:DmsE family decaheme c-type cytochrome
MTRHRVMVLVGAVLWIGALVVHAVAWAPPASPLLPPASIAALAAPVATDAIRPESGEAQQGGFAGQDTCVVCHEGFDTSISATKHGFVRDPRTPAAAQGCETCHGPAQAHTEDPENVKPPRVFTRMAPADVSATCTTCHNRTEHAFWSGSQHDSRNLGCTTCHSVHTPKSEHGQLRAKDQSAQCAPCHRDKVNKLDRSGHMPVREGKLQCTSCHNPHGSKNVRLLRAGFTVNETCATCHADKRGPFLWEHAPVRESCVTCHDPHGSSNDRMLVAKLPFLCQRCHVHTRHPATIYDQGVLATSNRIFGRSCVSCHAQIHGSNHPSGNFLVR